MPDAQGYIHANLGQVDRSGNPVITELPVYELNDVRHDMLRVESPPVRGADTPGALALTEIEDAAYPQLRVQTQSGPMAVTRSLESFPRLWEDFSYGKDHFSGNVDQWSFENANDRGSGKIALMYAEQNSLLASVSGGAGYPSPGDTWAIEFGTPRSLGTGEGAVFSYRFGQSSFAGGDFYGITYSRASDRFDLNHTSISGESTFDATRRRLAEIPVQFRENDSLVLLIRWFYDYRFSIEIYRGFGDQDSAGGTLIASEYEINHWPTKKFEGDGYSMVASQGTIVNRIRLWDRIVA